MKTSLYQTGVLLPTRPAGLGAAITIIGLSIVLGAYIQIIFRDIELQSKDNFDVKIKNRRLAAATFAGGIIFTSIGALQRYQLVIPYMGLLFFVGNLITGVSHVLFWKKVQNYLNGKNRFGSIYRNLKYILVSVFIIILFGSVLFALVTSDAFRSSFLFQLSILHTLLVLSLSVVGLSKRLLPLRGQMDNRVIYGFILTISGVQVFELSFLNDVIFILVGAVGYTVGFYLAIYYWLYG